ncbi:MAG: hypothetical protein NC221_03780 [Duncaniella sp.]|nr:hypothetical protein [Muribaculum sp.]MCM1255221.1 hypothetical protein [Duncaniella sp.]
MLKYVESRFGVELQIKTDTAGLMVSHAYSRIRPFSAEESLRNLTSQFDFSVVNDHGNNYQIRRYEHYRRPEADGAKLLSWLLTQYPSREDWEARRTSLQEDVLRISGVGKALTERVKGQPVISNHREYDRYCVENFYLETLPGLYVCGSIYLPASEGIHPLILCPNGHSREGRYDTSEQTRLATLARMGAICVSYDLYGYGDSELQVGKEGHTSPDAMTVQLTNGISILDFMLQRNDVDKSRVAVNGASGGGSQSILLGLIDPRLTVSCPVIMVSSHFDGGCSCESGKPITLAGGGSCLAEFAAAFAPKPMSVVSDGADWTSNVPEIEYPYLQKVYGLYGKVDQVSNAHFPDEGHDFGPNKRSAVYQFLAESLGLDKRMIDESKVTIESTHQLRSFDSDGTNMPANAIRVNQKG